ncbi:MAG: AraC family transcriptional regulator [Lachnospiraceae bacterium]|nr:AraC family transcriptional regulator [Lachnospiraceae bacterium]
MKKKIEIEVLKDSSEVVPYDIEGIPLYTRIQNLSEYLNMRAFPHWHDDIEMMYILKGRLNYHVNGKIIPLDTHACAITNCGQMHFSSDYEGEDCTFFCMIFHPRLVTGNSAIYKRSISPVLNNPDFQYRYFSAQHPFHDTIAELVAAIRRSKEEKAWGYELEIIGMLHGFYARFVRENGLLRSDHLEMDDQELKTQQRMLLFIHQHYMDKITLDDIADAGNVCRSRCCQIFRQYLDISPITFLNQYRLEISCQMLAWEDASITDIALRCGFIHNSYYAQIFRKTYGCSPKAYRQRHIKI